jgi:glycosyltransferase involved in cell wall biosynthesis
MRDEMNRAPGLTASGPVRIALVIASLGSGGAERVLSILANHWAAGSAEITLITLSATGGDFYPLHRRVRRVGLGLVANSNGLGRAITGNIQRLAGLRRAILAARPGVVISFEDTTNVLTVAATRGLGIPVIISQRVDPRFAPIGRAWSFLRRHFYPRADSVVVQTKTVAELMSRFVPESRLEVIPNPVLPPGVRGQRQPGTETGARPRRVLAVGRLCHQKGHDLLIHAFDRCRGIHPGWTLVLAGAGPDRADLEQLVTRLGLSDVVRFTGEIADMDTTYAAADMFVLPSRFEGFPNALCEAMAHGLPVISFDCPSGPSEIIRSGVDGILVAPGDAEALAAAMDGLMRDAATRAELGARAAESVRRFSAASILAKWEDLVVRVRRGRSLEPGG